MHEFPIVWEIDPQKMDHEAEGSYRPECLSCLTHSQRAQMKPNRAILEYVCSHVARRRICPSMRSLAFELG